MSTPIQLKVTDQSHNTEVPTECMPDLTVHGEMCSRRRSIFKNIEANEPREVNTSMLASIG